MGVVKLCITVYWWNYVTSKFNFKSHEDFFSFIYHITNLVTIVSHLMDKLVIGLHHNWFVRSGYVFATPWLNSRFRQWVVKSEFRASVSTTVRSSPFWPHVNYHLYRRPILLTRRRASPCIDVSKNSSYFTEFIFVSLFSFDFCCCYTVDNYYLLFTLIF